MTSWWQSGHGPDGTCDCCGGQDDPPDGGHGDPEATDHAYMQLCEEARGCGILDSGATRGVTSLNAADKLQMDRLDYGEPEVAKVSESGRSFRFGDGSGESTRTKISQPVTTGLLDGEVFDLHVVDKPSNDTPPLIGVDYMSSKRMVVDYHEGAVCFKAEDGTLGRWHKLPRSSKNLLLVPLTEEAQQRLMPSVLEEQAHLE